MSHACDGFLGNAQCWICTGDGCSRCVSSGRCHLCATERVLRLIPLQQARPEPAAQPQAASPS